MSRIRFRYSKTGKAGYISNLDLVTVMQRAFLRAGINLKYSEGFNPHPYVSVALPLSVGCESFCELLDVDIIDDTLPEIESIILPEGITIQEVYLPARKFNEIAWVEISSTLIYGEQTADDIIDSLINRFADENIVIQKRTKRGFKDLDIAPYIKDVEFISGKNISMTAKVSAQNPTVNISDLEHIFIDELKPVQIKLKRIEIYDSNMITYR